MKSMEFQAVILAAGIGSRFRDIVGNRPKCLLQVGGYPLIFYPLNFAAKYGFQEILIVVLESQKNEIAQKIAKLPLKIKYEFVTLSEEETGTGDALRQMKDLIYTDVLLLSCDVVTNIDFYPMLNMFRMHDASIVALFLNGSDASSSTVVPGAPSKQKQERDLIGLNTENNRLLFLASQSDFQDNLTLPGHLLRTHGKISIFSGLIDGHVYLVKKWVIDYLAKSDKFSTIKGELLPFIIKKQLSRPSNANAGLSEANFDTNDIFEHVRQNELSQKVLETNLNNFSRVKRSCDAELIRCFAYVAPSNSFCVRVNTTLNYCIVNNQIVSLFPSLVDNNPDATLISKAATINCTQMTDSAVGENATIPDKTSIKSSIIGTNCTVGRGTIITNSIIMSNVNIGEGCRIENSLVCDKAIIRNAVKMKNCFVGRNYDVAPRQKEEGEKDDKPYEKINFTCEDEMFMEI